MGSHTAAMPEAAAWRLARWPLVGMMLTQLTTNMFSVAIPTVVADLHIGLERSAWIISAYLLPAVLMPTWGAAGDHWGRPRVVRIGLSIFAIGAAVTGLASILPLVILGQLIQATGAAALNPNGTALIAAASGAQTRGRALGRLRLILSLAGIIGAPIGGLLVQIAGWHAVFVAPPVIAMTLALLIGRQQTGESPIRGVPFDIAGALTLSITLLAALAALTAGPALGWTASPVLALVGLSLIGLMLIGPLESRQSRPLLAPALIHQPAYRATIITSWLQAFACFGTALLAPILIQRHFGIDPALAGAVQAAYPIGMAASGLPGGRLADHFGPQATTIGSLIGVLIGLTLLTASAWLAQPLLFLPGSFMTGFSAGAGLVAMNVAVFQISGPEQHGVGQGLFSMVSIMGDAVGIVLLSLPLAGRSDPQLGGAFALIYGLAALVAGLALLPALAIRVPSTAASHESVKRGASGA